MRSWDDSPRATTANTPMATQIMRRLQPNGPTATATALLVLSIVGMATWAYVWLLVRIDPSLREMCHRAHLSDHTTRLLAGPFIALLTAAFMAREVRVFILELEDKGRNWRQMNKSELLKITARTAWSGIKSLLVVLVVIFLSAAFAAGHGTPPPPPPMGPYVNSFQS